MAVVTIEDLRTGTIVSTENMENGDEQEILGYKIILTTSPVKPVANKPVANKEVSNIFHKLWTEAVGKEGYVKDDWKKFSSILYSHGIVV